MKQLSITNSVPDCAGAPILSVASDEVFTTTSPPHKSSEGLNKKKRCRIPQRWTVSGDTASADIGGGNIAVVDLVDLPLVQGRKWFPLYREHNTYASHGQGVLMHRLVSGAGEGERIDHEDNNGLNNRRHNLRPATQSQNRANSRRFCSGQSKYKGIRHNGSSWTAACGRTHLGSFATEELAARAYDVAAQKLWGSFAKLNFPPPLIETKAA